MGSYRRARRAREERREEIVEAILYVLWAPVVFVLHPVLCWQKLRSVTIGILNGASE